MRNAELRQALRSSIGMRLAEAGRRRINLHELSFVLGVTERTLRNWRDAAQRSNENQGRPRHSPEKHEHAREEVFEVMRKRAVPGWRPVAAELAGKVPVRLIQIYVAEYKALHKKKRTPGARVEVKGKNVIWSMDGAFTKNEKKTEHQLVKDRGTKAWVGHQENASKTADAVDLLADSFERQGVPLVISSDNGSAYKSQEFARLMRQQKIVHLKSLPRTPQHNGAVEVGIKELREIMDSSGIKLDAAVEVANDRLRKFGKEWSSAGLVYKNTNVVYTENERAEFFNCCERRLSEARNASYDARELRMREREIILDELEVRGYIEVWKMADNRF